MAKRMTENQLTFRFHTPADTAELEKAITSVFMEVGVAKMMKMAQGAEAEMMRTSQKSA